MSRIHSLHSVSVLVRRFNRGLTKKSCQFLPTWRMKTVQAFDSKNIFGAFDFDFFYLIFKMNIVSSLLSILCRLHSMHRINCRILLFALLWGAGYAAPFLRAPHSQAGDRLLINSDSLRSHVKYLADDALQGRAVGTAGSRQAAEYIRGHLARWQLQALAPLSGYLQPVPLHGSTALVTSSLRFFLTDRITDYTLNDDYLLYQYGAQTFLPVPLAMVFVGYGIIAPEYDYNDYQNLDVAGKIVVFLSGEPPSADPGFFEADELTLYAAAETKARIAISRGAAASVMIADPELVRDQGWRRLQREFSFEHVTLTQNASAHLFLVLHPERANELFTGTAVSLAQVLQWHHRHTMHSLALQGKMSFHGEFKQRDFVDHNVIGMIAGDDKKRRNEFIVVSAHYDHLGISEPVRGDSIYNGAVDNSLGVAGVLELARCFALSPGRPQRSILFLFTTAEEKGLLGAEYFLSHSPIPLYRMVANINLEGLAFIDRFREVIGIGGEWSNLGEWLRGTVAEQGVTAVPMPRGFSAMDALLHGDQLAFARAGIPCLLISEGLVGETLLPQDMMRRRLQWQRDYYHSPQDDAQQPINWAAAEQHAAVLLHVLDRLSHSAFEPEWVPQAPFRAERMRSIAEKR